MFQVAFGILKLDKETFWSMTPREFLNAWIGHTDERKQELAGLWNIARYNAMRTAFSKEQQKAIQKDRNPFVDRPKRKEPMSFDDMVPMLKTISKPQQN